MSKAAYSDSRLLLLSRFNRLIAGREDIYIGDFQLDGVVGITHAWCARKGFVLNIKMDAYCNDVTISSLRSVAQHISRCDPISVCVMECAIRAHDYFEGGRAHGERKQDGDTETVGLED